MNLMKSYYRQTKHTQQSIYCWKMRIHRLLTLYHSFVIRNSFVLATYLLMFKEFTSDMEGKYSLDLTHMNNTCERLRCGEEKRYHCTIHVILMWTVCYDALESRWKMGYFQINGRKLSKCTAKQQQWLAAKAIQVTQPFQISEFLNKCSQMFTAWNLLV